MATAGRLPAVFACWLYRHVRLPTANLRTGADVSSKGLWDYPATITDPSIAKQVSQFGPGGPFSSSTTATIINDFGSRQQMVWFMTWATKWSQSSNFLTR
ncbi:hypothetical protein EPUS_07449 [Endocarpon pusillum Z07020]|uniref:Agd3 CBM87 domain-containing protein n=1 Tax=Endocarpon pusillum (strain Z07020 / HMAS-L-300199) TaxID=1263415 RepID=U1HS36_ENDPU|nr:uncharacterized protein EPUS_07449 [Endocarpon pusillum Z07020]ERF71979.1 hypothetical protein EPUS_07449 [Endocarpon pusillum Z07020]